MRNPILHIRKIPENWIYLIFMTCLAAVIFFFKIDRNSLTLDEVSTISISRNFQNMMNIFWNKEANMWLYYLIVHLWLKVGDSELIIRSLSAIFGVFSALAFFLFAKETVGQKVAKIALPLFILNMYIVFYAQMARSYSLTLFLFLAQSYFFIRCVKYNFQKRHIVLYVFLTALGIYTHLLFGFTVMAQYLSFLLLPTRIPWKKISLMTVAIGVLLLPVLLSPSLRGPQMDWLQKPPLVHLPMAFIILSSDSIVLTTLFGILIGFFLFNNLHRFTTNSWNRFILSFFILCTLFPIFFGFVESLLAKPVYEPESFIATLPTFILLLSLALIQFRKSIWIYRILMVVIFAFLFARLIDWYRGANHDHVVINNINERDWRKITNFTLDRSKVGDVVIFYAYYVHSPFEYYLNHTRRMHKPTILEISSHQYDLGGGTVLPEPNISLLDHLNENHKRIWLILSYNNFDWLNRKKQWLLIESEINKFFVVKEDTKFDQIEVKLLEKKQVNTHGI